MRSARRISFSDVGFYVNLAWGLLYCGFTLGFTLMGPLGAWLYYREEQLDAWTVFVLVLFTAGAFSCFLFSVWSLCRLLRERRENRS